MVSGSQSVAEAGRQAFSQTHCATQQDVMSASLLYRAARLTVTNIAAQLRNRTISQAKTSQIAGEVAVEVARRSRQATR